METVIVKSVKNLYIWYKKFLRGVPMNGVNKTLYIPLYGKAYVSKKGIILNDKTAEQIWEKEGFELKGKSKSKWLAYYMGMRSAVFDNWLKAQMEDFYILTLHQVSLRSETVSLSTQAEFV